MRVLIFIAATVCLFGSARTQNKYDQVWLTGGSGTFDLSLFYGGTTLDFTTEPPVITAYELPTSLGTVQGFICDEVGKPLLLSNGCYFFGYDGEIIENSDSLNYPGYSWDHSCKFPGYDYTVFDGGKLVLPAPGNDSRYYMFHLRLHGLTAATTTYESSLLYSVVDMSLNNSKGRVLEKNQEIVRDSLADNLNAVRHGNGRDWWVFSSGTGNDNVFLFLLDPSGVHGPFKTKSLGLRKANPDDYPFLGYVAFSPNGKWMARADVINGIQVANFDRCSGQFSCVTNIPFPQSENGYSLDFSLKDPVYATGLAISPNSRFMYVSTGYRLFQFDLQAKDIAGSIVQVGEYDGQQFDLGATIFQGQLAPNGKIYWTCTNGERVMHIIHRPDEKGMACEFENHGLHLLTYNGFGTTIYPNFRLYDWANSPCDSLGINAPDDKTTENWVGNLQIIPNPVFDKASVRIPDGCSEGAVLRLFAVTGQLIHDYGPAMPSVPVEIDSQFLADGIYFLCLVSGKKIIGAAKMMVIKN